MPELSKKEFVIKASSLCHLQIPGESPEYRVARNALLAEEMELRRRIERVAVQRRALPAGGAIPEDYKFEGDGGPVNLSELFASGQDTLAIYSFMYGPERERPCPGCTHFLDGLDGAAEHISQRLSIVVVAKSSVPRILAFAKERGWRRSRLLSTAGNSYDRDYFGDSTGLPAAIRVQQEFKTGEEWDMPMLNVSAATEERSVISGLLKCSMCRPSPVRNIVTTMPLIRSGTCLTSLPRDGATFILS